MDSGLNSTISSVDKFLGSEIVSEILVWQALFIFCSVIVTILILLCCCISFRIPRTKQEIEADYIRKQITRKFRKQLDLIQDSEMDEMDLVKAVEKVRFKLMSDEEKALFSVKLNNEPIISQVKDLEIEENSDAIGNSDERLMGKNDTAGTINSKLVTVINAFNILRSKKPSVGNSKQITV